MKKNILFAISGLLFTLACSREQTQQQPVAAAATVEEVRPANSAIQHLTVPEADNLLDQNKNVVVLDVRSREEFNRGHLENAINLDVESPDFEEKLKGLEPDRTYLIYCAAGSRSAVAADMMLKHGFTHIFNCRQGFDDLKEGNLPVQE
ncbi:MAG TPA: rhodanese-like domain-containing protein [Adhaeribacter sp.]|nr:rhodanese-like domain-containing protein [Adhaeribacter sp.]